VAAGADLVTGGTHDGLFYKPTVLGNVASKTRAFQEEIFGPVAPVTIAEDEDHAVELANQTGYGLAAAVQTGSVERGLRVARKLKPEWFTSTIRPLPIIPASRWAEWASPATARASEAPPIWTSSPSGSG